jgi:hypothetical protein
MPNNYQKPLEAAMQKFSVVILSKEKDPAMDSTPAAQIQRFASTRPAAAADRNRLEPSRRSGIPAATGVHPDPM